MITIRTFTADDQSAWLNLWKGYLDFYNVTLSDDSNTDVWERLLNDADPLQGFCAELDGELVGFVHYFFHGTTWFQSSYCYLEDLYVSASARGQSGGRALIRAVEEAARNQGAAKLYWHTDGKNQRARGLYDKVATLTDFVRYDISLTND